MRMLHHTDRSRLHWALLLASVTAPPMLAMSSEPLNPVSKAFHDSSKGLKSGIAK